MAKGMTRETKAATRGAAAPAKRKSMKMEADELTEKIKACVKEALEEQDEAKAEGEGEDEAASAVEAAPADIADIIEQAMDVVAEKRKSRKDDGEELGDITTDEVLEAVAEIIEATGGDDEAKDDDGVEDEEAKDDDEAAEEGKRRKSANRPKQTKKAARASSARPAQRKYADIYMSRSSSTGGASKKTIDRKSVV